MVDSRLTLDAGTAGGSGNSSGGGQAQVLLAHLKSYAGMGRARVECRSGCTCEPSVLEGHWGVKASMQMIHKFRASQSARCTLRVTVLQQTGSGGRKVKLAGLMVLPANSGELGEKMQRLIPQQIEMWTEKLPG